MKLENINSIKISRNDFPLLQHYGNYCVEYVDNDGKFIVSITGDLKMIMEDIKDNFSDENITYFPDGSIRIENKSYSNQDLILEEVEFSVRTYKRLKELGIKNVSDIANYSRKDLLQLKGFGRKSLREVQIELGSRNLEFKKGKR